MFTVYILNYGKNHKSIEQPNLTGVTSVSMKLKAPSNILNPVFEMQITPSNQASWVNANYAYVPDFKRYYYITNTTLNGNLVILSMTVDVLASWKTAITGSTQYVLRSSSNYDGTIKDTKYPLKAVNPNYSITYGDQQENPFQPSGQNTLGSFVVGVVQKGSPFGTVSYYAMSQLVFSDFMTKLFNLPTQWGNDSSVTDGVKKAITDPTQYVISVIWYPYSINDYVNLGIVQNPGGYGITVGYDTITLGAVCYPFNTAVNLDITNVINLTLPDHPQAASRGAYMNFEPYSRYYLSFYPFCDMAELDSTLVGGLGTIYCLYTIDMRTGRGVLSVCRTYTGNSQATYKPQSPIRVFEAQVGVELPVAAIRTEIPRLGEYLTNVTTAAAEQFGGFKQIGSRITDSVSNWMASGLQKLFANDQAAVEALDQYKSEIQPITKQDTSEIRSNAAAMKSTAEVVGSQGTMSLYSRMPLAIWGNFFTAADDQVNKFGRPLCKNVALNTLSGFCQCDTPFISATGMTLKEQLDIESMLAEGIYLV